MIRGLALYALALLAAMIAGGLLALGQILAALVTIATCAGALICCLLLADS